MRDKLRDIVKGILSEEFDAGSAFKFIKQKEGRGLPREYVLSALKSGDISKLSIPEDLGDDEEFWQIYKFVHAPETLTEEELHMKGNLYLSRCTSLEKLPEGLSVGGYLYLRGCTSLRSLPEGLSVGEDLYLNECTSLRELPRGLSVGGNLYFKRTDPIPQRFDEDANAVRKYIEQELGGKVNEQIIWRI